MPARGMLGDWEIRGHLVSPGPLLKELCQKNLKIRRMDEHREIRQPCSSDTRASDARSVSVVSDRSQKNVHIGLAPSLRPIRISIKAAP